MANREIEKLVYTIEVKDGKVDVDLLRLKKGFDGLETGMRSADNTSRGLWKQFAVGTIAANALTRGLSSITSGFTSLIKNTIIAGAQYEQTQIAFETMLGSAEKGQAFLKELSDFAVKTPFTIQGVEQNAKQLLAMGIEAENVLPDLKAIGDVSSGLSVPLDRLAYNYGQVKAQTRLTGVELRDFARAGVPLISELAKNIGVTEQRIKEMVSEGEIGFEQVRQAFQTMTAEGGRFDNLMARQSQTLSGLASNLQDAFTRFLREAGSEGIQKFKGSISKLISALEDESSSLAQGLNKIIGSLADFSDEVVSKFVKMVEDGTLQRMANDAAEAVKVFLQLAGVLADVVIKVSQIIQGLDRAGQIEEIAIINEESAERLRETTTNLDDNIARMRELVNVGNEAQRTFAQMSLEALESAKKQSEAQVKLAELRAELTRMEDVAQERKTKQHYERLNQIREEIAGLNDLVNTEQKNVSQIAKVKQEYYKENEKALGNMFEAEKNFSNAVSILGEEEAKKRIDILNNLTIAREDFHSDIEGLEIENKDELISIAEDLAMNDVGIRRDVLAQKGNMDSAEVESTIRKNALIIASAQRTKNSLVSIFSQLIVQNVLLRFIQDPAQAIASARAKVAKGVAGLFTFKGVQENIASIKNITKEITKTSDETQKLQDAFNDIGNEIPKNLGGGGGGGGKGGRAARENKEEMEKLKEEIKATEKEVDNIGDAYKEYEDTVKDSTRTFERVRDASNDMINDINKSYKDLNREIAKLNESYIELKNSIEQTFETATLENQQDFLLGLSERRLEIEKELADLQTELSKETEQARRNELQERITALKTELQESKDIFSELKQEGIEAEETLKQVREDSLKSQSQLALEEFRKTQQEISDERDKALTEAEEEFLQQQQVLEERQKVLDTVKEIAEIQKALAEDAIERTTTVEERRQAEEELQALRDRLSDLKTEEAQDLADSLLEKQIALQEELLLTIQNEEQKRQVFQDTANKIFDINDEMISKLSDRYQELTAEIEEAIRKATQLNSLSGSAPPPGFMAGGFTGEGAPSSVAGVVHKNEYVAPAWMVKAFPSMFGTLEKIRSGGTVNNSKETNVNVYNNSEADDDLAIQASRLRWLLKGV